MDNHKNNPRNTYNYGKSGRRDIKKKQDYNIGLQK